MTLKVVWTVVVFLALAVSAHAQLPEGPGRDVTERTCKNCHEISKAVTLRQDRSGWTNTIVKMLGLGMKAGDDDLETVLDYLTKNFPAEELPPININKARAIQLESRLSLKRSEASAILRYRKEHGDFKSVEDVLKVPGIDVAKVEAKRDVLVF